MFFSVIIPNYNGSVFIDKLFRSILSQTLPIDKYEIIIVDNGSTDNSVELLEKYAETISNLKVIVYTNERGSYAARNFAVSKSKGDVLVFTDIDCQPANDWLSLISEITSNITGNFLISGEVELFPLRKEFNYYEWYDLMFSLNQENYAKSQTGATANLIVSRNTYEKVGGFKSLISGGDRDFCLRVNDSGGAGFQFHPKIKVLHPARNTAKEIVNKAIRVSEGIAVLKFQNLSPRRRVLYILKQILGLFIQPNQIRQIVVTFVKKGWFDLWSWKFAIIALRMGFIARRRLIKKFLELSFDKAHS